MPLGLKRSKIPLYVQLEQIIRSDITMGELSPGQKIPTERAFADTYSVSIITARQAILNLVDQGLLIRKQGIGTFVTETPVNVKNIMTLSIKGDLHEIVPEGLASQQVRVVDSGRTKIPLLVSKALNVDPTEEVYRIRRIRSEQGVAISYVKNYLAVEIGEKISEEDLLAYPMMYILRHKLGIPLKNGTQYIQAVAADYDIASALSANIASPILYMETTIFREDAKPVEFVQSFFRSDQFKYTIRLDLNQTTTA
jgi:GntR family transcriptional regulator